MSRKKNKKEAEKQIKEFFENIKDKNQREVKKIKGLAMHHNIKLGKLKRKFCNKCFNPLENNSRKRLNNGKMSITCLNCGNIKRYSYKDKK